MKRVYVAGPLSGTDRLANVERAMQAGRELIVGGYAPLVPHLTNYMDPSDALGYETWIAVCLAWVAVADCVLRLPGASVGADRECKLARSLGIPVWYSITDLAIHERQPEAA